RSDSCATPLLISETWPSKFFRFIGNRKETLLPHVKPLHSMILFLASEPLPYCAWQGVTRPLTTSESDGYWPPSCERNLLIPTLGARLIMASLFCGICS